jgi:hypothetical protein
MLLLKGDESMSEVARELSDADREPLVIPPFKKGPMLLLGSHTQPWDFPPGPSAALYPLKVTVPPGTEYALVVLTTVGLMFGQEHAEKKGTLGRVLFQVRKEEISGGSFNLDIVAGLKSAEGVGSSGKIDIEILCFGYK